ncbi:hypothetical protein [Mesorhizobium sp. M0701]|uniref:hypothetical protein n=1 Tax=Mesorhizobium sp. M0701 TaxID=2956989 RepID=UPI00333B3EE6
MSVISEGDVIAFSFAESGLGLGEHRAMGASKLRCKRGGRLPAMRYAVRVATSDGYEGRYATRRVGTQSAPGQTPMLAPHLLGRNPEHRDKIYDDLKREACAYDFIERQCDEQRFHDEIAPSCSMKIAGATGSSIPPALVV